MQMAIMREGILLKHFIKETLLKALLLCAWSVGTNSEEAFCTILLTTDTQNLSGFVTIITCLSVLTPYSFAEVPLHLVLAEIAWPSYRLALGQIFAPLIINRSSSPPPT